MHLANRIEYRIKTARKRIAVSLKIASEKASCENWRVPFFEYYNIEAFVVVNANNSVKKEIKARKKSNYVLRSER